MKTKWMSWSMAVALGIAAIAATALAQERPVQEARPAPEALEVVAGDARAVDDMEDLGGLDQLLAADVAPGARGAGHREGPGMRGGARKGQGRPGGAEFREKLNLSDDQKTKLADIRDRQERASIPVQSDLRIASLDLRKLMRADKPDKGAIDVQIDRIASLRATLHKSRVASMLDARSMLTPAQQKLMKEHRGGLMGHRMRGGHGRHGGQGMRTKHL